MFVEHEENLFEADGTGVLELPDDAEWSECLWDNYSADPPRAMSAEELDEALCHGAFSSVARAPQPCLPALPPASPWSVRRPGDTVKRLLDILGAITLAVVLCPLLLVVGIALARDRGPILFSHPRTGRHGKTFGCLKFRTMVPNAEQVLRDLLHRDPALSHEWLHHQKLRNDPRVTAIGRFLRRTSLDELPQLWNVLKGDMSLVGPRPVVHEECARYGRRLETYLAAKPGVTGLWQVMGRSDTGYRRRVALDSYYVRKRNLMMDCYILLRTVKIVLRGRGAC